MGDYNHKFPFANHQSPAHSSIAGELKMVMGGINHKSAIVKHQFLKRFEGPGKSGVVKRPVGAAGEFHFGLR